MSKDWKRKLISVLTIFSLILCSIVPCLAEEIEVSAESEIPDLVVEEDFNPAPEFKKFNDPNLLPYIEDTLYSELVETMNSEEYFVENVSAVYISQEYLDEFAFNSKANIFFGYSLAELNEQFQGEKYIFTLGNNNETVVEPWEDYDDTYDRILKNVAVGTGVILICVTVSVVTAGTGAYAASMIFAVAAKSGAIGAASGAALGGVSAGIVTGIQTGDMGEALKAGALASSEGFKWGAITGAITGGVSEGIALKGATLNGLTMDQAAMIQKESKYPLDVIKEFHSVDEYQVFRDANLKPMMVGNKSALIKTDIDLTKIDSKGRTNLERMRQGLAPQDSNGVSYELHHIGQRKDGTLAILSQSEHDSPAIHGFLKRTEAHGPDTNWDAVRQAFWKAFAALVG